MSNAPVTTAPTTAAEQAATEMEHNPLFRLEQGKPIVSNLPLHLKSAKVGNLFFEYAQNVPQLRGAFDQKYGTAGQQIANWLESKNLITVDRNAGTYMWIGEPLTRAQFLQLMRKGQIRAV